MTSTFGAPLGGTIRGGQYGMDVSARFSIRPPKGAGGLGRDLPSMVVVALGAPGAPVVCWALAEAKPRTVSTTIAIRNVLVFIVTFSIAHAAQAIEPRVFGRGQAIRRRLGALGDHLGKGMGAIR